MCAGVYGGYNHVVSCATSHDSLLLVSGHRVNVLSYIAYCVILDCWVQGQKIEVSGYVKSQRRGGIQEASLTLLGSKLRIWYPSALP